MTQEFSITATRAAALALVVGLSGCSIFSSSEPTDDTIDYRKSARKVAPLDVPPDLTPLVRDGRYAVQAGRVSASDLANGAKAQAAATPGATVALNTVGDVRIERFAIRDKQTPLETWQRLRVAFPDHPPGQLAVWTERFFTLWSRNQWKRERYAPSFHLDDENLDPKTWCRFPILSGGFTRELADLRATVAATG